MKLSFIAIPITLFLLMASIFSLKAQRNVGDISSLVELTCLGQCLEQPNTNYIPSVFDIIWISDESQIIAMDEDKSVIIWDTNSQSIIFELNCNVNGQWSYNPMAYSINSNQVFLGCTNPNTISDLTDTDIEYIHVGHIGNTVAISPNGDHIAVGDLVSNVEIWSTDPLEKVEFLRAEGNSQISSMGWSPNGDFLAVASWNGRRGQLIIWDMLNESMLYELSGFFDFAWSPDSKYIASLSSTYPSDNAIVNIWDIDDGQVLQSYTIGIAAIASFAWHPFEDILAIGTSSSDIHFVDTQSDQVSTLISNAHVQEGGMIWDIVWSEDGYTLASAGEDGDIIIWERR